MSISSLSCILVNHQPTMRKNLQEVTRKSTPVMVRTWKQTRKTKKQRQLCSMESLLFCAVSCQPAGWELQLNQLASKHRDWSRLGHATFSHVLSAGGEPQGERESAWTVKLHFFPRRLMARRTTKPDCCWELWDLCIQPTALQPTSQAEWICPLK